MMDIGTAVFQDSSITLLDSSCCQARLMLSNFWLVPRNRTFRGLDTRDTQPSAFWTSFNYISQSVRQVKRTHREPSAALLLSLQRHYHVIAFSFLDHGS